MIETLSTSSECTPAFETLYRLLPLPKKGGNSFKTQIKVLHLKLKPVVLFVGRKQGTARAFGCKFDTLSFGKTCILSCSCASISHYISLQGTSYVTEEGCVDSET